MVAHGVYVTTPDGENPQVSLYTKGWPDWYTVHRASIRIYEKPDHVWREATNPQGVELCQLSQLTRVRSQKS